MKKNGRVVCCEKEKCWGGWERQSRSDRRPYHVCCQAAVVCVYVLLGYSVLLTVGPAIAGINSKGA